MVQFCVDIPEPSELIHLGIPLKVLHKENKAHLTCWYCGKKTIAQKIFRHGRMGHSLCKWCGEHL